MSLEMFSNVTRMFSNVTRNVFECHWKCSRMSLEKFLNVTENNFNVGPYTACSDLWFISKRVYIESVMDRLVSIKTVNNRN